MHEKASVMVAETADEVEVTQEMIEAGMKASWEEFIWGEDDAEICIELIIRAALKAVRPVV